MQGSLNTKDRLPVVVIGGGISGLSAAIHLKTLAPKTTVVILEATAQLGGRVKSVKSGKYTYDLGASWFHDSANNILFDFVTQNKWNCTKDLNDKTELIITNNETQNMKIITDPRHLLDGVDHILENIGDDASVFDMSLKDYAEKYDPQNSVVYRAFEHFVGSGWGSISAVECPQNVFNHGDDYFQHDGNMVLIDLLAAKAEALGVIIHLKKPVKEVIDSQNFIKVNIGSSEVKAQKVVITASPAVVRSSNMLNGDIPRALEFAIRDSKMAHLTKLIFEFPYKFWYNSNKTVVIMEDKGSYFVSEVNPTALMVIVPPMESFALEQSTEKFEDLLPLFKIIHKDNPGRTSTRATKASNGAEESACEFNTKPNIGALSVPNPVNVLCSDWTKNVFTQGSYSTLYPGQNMRDYVLPFKDEYWSSKLFFAGEHTSINGIGCMDGAYDSGIRVAQQITGKYLDSEQN